MPANRYNRRYLSTKARKSGHMIEDPTLEQEEPALERVPRVVATANGSTAGATNGTAARGGAHARGR